MAYANEFLKVLNEAVDRRIESIKRMVRLASAECLAIHLFNPRDNEKKAAKVSTARDLWVTAVNNHGGFGRWAFLEVTDPWDAQNAIRKAIRTC